MVHPFPLRYILPLGFLALSVLLMAVAYELRSEEIARRNEALMLQRATGLGQLIAPELQSKLARGAPDPEQPFFARLLHIPHLKTALVCDETGLILIATREALRDHRVADLAPAAGLLLRPGREGRAARFEFSADRGTLWAAFPLSLGQTGAGDTRLGWLCTESDVAAQTAPAIAAQRNGNAVIGGIILVVCAGLWFYFDRTVTRRVSALVATTRALAAGQADTRAVSQGADELAQLGAAFNGMAAALQAREAAARRTERRATDAIQASGMGTWAWNLETGECADNSGWARILGYDPAAIGLHLDAWKALVHPEDLPGVLAAFTSHQSGRTPRYSVEYRMRHKAGHWTWVHDDGEVTERDASGGPVRIVGTCRDVTPRKQAELALRESEARFRSMADAAPVLIWVAGVDKDCTYFNRRWLDFTGRTLEQELGNGWAEGVHPEDLVRCLEIYTGSFNARRPFEMEYRLRRHDGAYRWLFDHGGPRLLADGSFTGYIGSCIDVTERRELEASLRRINRTYVVLSEINQLIGRGPETETLLEAACQIAVEQGGFGLAWIGLSDAPTGSLRRVAHAGATPETLAVLDEIFNDPQRGCAFTTQAVRSGAPAICNDVAQDPRAAPWRAAALERHYHAMASLPIMVDAAQTGVLNLYAGEPGFFDDAEMKLLQELALDLSYALKANRQKAELAAAATALAQTELQMAAVFRASPAAISINTVNSGRLIEVNAAYCDFFGYQREELLGRTIFELHLWAEPTARTPIIERLRREGRVRNAPVQFCTKSGEVRDALLSFEPIAIPGEPEPALICVFTDITDRIRAEKQLRQSEERFEKAFRASPVAIFISKLADGRLVDVNQAFLELFGYQRRDEVIGRTSLELNMWDNPADRQRVVAALAQKGALPYFECGLRRPTGERRDGLASVELIELDGDRCMLALVYDITDRKQTEDALRQSEAERANQLAMLEASFNSLSEGVILTELDGNIYYWNRAALAMHSYASLDECRRRLPDFADTFELTELGGDIVPLDQWPIVRILRGEIVRDWECRLRHKGAGWEKLFVYTGELARDAAGAPLLAILSFTEVTERRQLEEQLRQSQKMDAIGQLAGGVAHDFNNILTGVILHADLAASHPETSADARATLGEIGRLAHRAAGLTRQLLAFSRRSVMQREPLNLNAVVTADASMLRRLVGENVRLELTLHPRPLPVVADEGMIGQVLLNLAVNARDAMPRGGRLSIETSESVVEAGGLRASPDAAPGRYACVCIKDAGSGIAPEHLSRVFEPFFTTKPVGQGTGLGLATVYGIVRQHQGWITVASAPGEGATFLVGLPLVAAPAETAKAGAIEVPPGGTETILLVEDEEPVRTIISILLSRHGYHVLEAEHGPAALEIWRREKSTITLLLTDLVMPTGMTGQELAAKLQAESPALKVVFTTGYSAEIAGRGLQLQPQQNFLQKPYVIADLLATVRRAIDARLD